MYYLLYFLTIKKLKTYIPYDFYNFKKLSNACYNLFPLLFIKTLVIIKFKELMLYYY
jgi:hypothetical protein